MFREYQCSASLRTICSASAKRSDSKTWKTGKQYCKDQGTYPKGNISLSDITRTCAEPKDIGLAPHWVGVVKEMYQKEDQGQLITTAEQTSIKQCMKCLFDESYPLPDCQYVYCDLNLTTAVSCSKIRQHNNHKILISIIQKQQEECFQPQWTEPRGILLLI